MISNPTAKARFLKNGKAVDQHQEMVKSDIFQYSADAAMLEYQEMLQAGPDNSLNNAAGSYLRLLGAREFLLVLRNLGERETVGKTPQILKNLETRES